MENQPPNFLAEISDADWKEHQKASSDWLGNYWSG